MTEKPQWGLSIKRGPGAPQAELGVVSEPGSPRLLLWSRSFPEPPGKSDISILLSID